MAVAFKLTNIFQLSTVPDDPSVASIHTGGWTENWWTNVDLRTVGFGVWNALQQARAALLPASAKIIGYRFTKYDFVGNYLTPGGSLANRQNSPGVIGNLTDLPQVALQLRGRATSGASNNITLRGIPDTFMSGGEYAPTPAFRTSLNAFGAKLIAGSFGFIGRDKTQASVRVMSGSTETVRISAIPSTGLAVGDFVRLNRVVASNGRAVKGTFQIASMTTTPPSLILVGWPTGVTVTRPSGTLRRDQIAYLPYESWQVVRAVVKKVGSPLEKYRGRASKKVAV